MNLSRERGYSSKTPTQNCNLEKLSDIVGGSPEKLFHYFQIPFSYDRSRIYCECMIHGGDNKNGLNIYMDGDTAPFIWKCRTHKCDRKFKKTVIGFTRALLSVKHCEYRVTGNMFSFYKTIDFLLDLYNLDPAKLVETKEEREKKFFLAATAKPEEKKGSISREEVRARLDIPADYFIERGFDAGTLDFFDVGWSKKNSGPMKNRVIVPVYDEDFRMIGCTGRSPYPECPKCQSYHAAGCPTCGTIFFPKWKHSTDLGFTLYNLCHARPSLLLKSSAIIVESPGNVWRLKESGIDNAVAIFGTNFTEMQQQLLDKCGVMDLLLMMDGDDAGRDAVNTITEKCERYYNIRNIVVPDGKDVADLSPDVIKNLIK